MEKKKLDLKTWWWYHRFHVLLAAAALGLALYAVLPNLLAPKADYSLALVSAGGLPEERVEALRQRVEALADDRNGDGRVLVEAQLYQADLSGETAGTVNYSEAARLDADLIGKVSALLFFDEPAGFEANVAVPYYPPLLCEELPALAGLLPPGWYLAVRSDCGAEALRDAITAP